MGSWRRWGMLVGLGWAVKQIAETAKYTVKPVVESGLMRSVWRNDDISREERIPSTLSPQNDPIPLALRPGRQQRLRRELLEAFQRRYRGSKPSEVDY